MCSDEKGKHSTEKSNSFLFKQKHRKENLLLKDDHESEISKFGKKK
jgi:hypothetical protein